MNKYTCTVCGYVYDESKGIPEMGIAAGTAWEAIADDWACPLCGASKGEFKLQGAFAANVTPPKAQSVEDMKELTPFEMSALCSNLAKGCEKQYKPAEAALFTELAGYYKAKSAPARDADFGEILSLIESDLTNGFPAANAACIDDRGALRALVWSEKVTRILKSLLTRYEKEGDAMFENAGVYVCAICGFVYIGDTPPEICPVCKVPNWKFEKIEGRAM